MAKIVIYVIGQKGIFVLMTLQAWLNHSKNITKNKTLNSVKVFI